MKHKHHIIPKHMGGTDDPSNLIELTREEHAAAHLKLYETHGKKQDLGAYYLLTGQTDEAFRICSVLGGLAQGKINSETGHMRSIQKLGDVVENGRKGGNATIAAGKGAFGDPIQRLKAASNGGKKGGATNAKSGHLKRIAQLPNDRNRGLFWITNGVESKMIRPTELIESGWYRGRVQSKKI